MSKKVFAIILILLCGVWLHAGPGIDFLLENGPERYYTDNHSAFAFVIKALTAGGADTSGLTARLPAMLAEGDLTVRAFALLASEDPTLAAQLCASQEADGSWGGDLQQSLMITYSLTETGLEPANVSNALAYIISRQNSDGGWGAAGQSVVTETALAVLALSKTGIYPLACSRGLDWLILHQDSSGGWDNHPATAWAVLALLRSGTYPDQLAAAVKYLQITALPDGSWGIYLKQQSHLLTTALVVLALQAYHPGLPEVTQGLNWLQQQVAAQFWLAKSVAYYSLSEIFYLLRNDTEFSRLQRAYAGYLMDFPLQTNTDFLARRCSLLVLLNEPSAALVSELLNRQNPDFGWGFAAGYASNPLDTALVLRALLDTGYTDYLVYWRIVTYLTNAVNNDGSFAFSKYNEGHLYLTAMVAGELIRLSRILNCSALSEGAVAWLAAQRNSGGAYGTGLLETGAALRVITDRLLQSEYTESFALIETNRLANGSWDNDPLTTAVMLAVLNLAKPNLSIMPADLNPSPTAGYLNQIVTIEANVHNTGFKPVRQTTAALYLGDPATGNVLNTKPIELLEAGASLLLTFSWVPAGTGNYNLTVVLDPQNLIYEKDETDNSAGRMIRILPRTDLAVYAAEVTVSPDDPGPADELRLSAPVSNNGYLDSGAFTVSLTNAPFGSSGDIIAQSEYPNLPGQSSVIIDFTFQLPQGEHRLYLTVDSGRQVAEDREDNNQAIISLLVEPRTDLAISSDQIAFSNAEPVASEQVLIHAVITNRREESVTDVPVAFYVEAANRNPELLGIVTLERIGGRQSTSATWQWDTSGQSGRMVIRVVLDPDNIIKEVNKTNNTALKVIYITPLPELAVTNITTSALAEGVPGRFTITVNNTGGTVTGVPVRIYAGPTTAAPLFCNDLTIPQILFNNNATFYIPVDTLNLAGTHTILIHVDPDNAIAEGDESNNQREYTYTINPAPEFVITPQDFTFIPEVVHEGDRVLIKITINKITRVAVNNVKLQLYVEMANDWQLLDEVIFNSTANQQQHTFTFSWNSDSQTGVNRFKCILDPEFVIYENNKRDNLAFCELEVLAATMPDLAVSEGSIAVVPPELASGESGSIQAEIINLRSVAADSASVSFYDGDPGKAGTLIGSQTIAVSGKGRTIAAVAWKPSGLGNFHEIHVLVDPARILTEYDETNNHLTGFIALRGDPLYQPQNLAATVVNQTVNLQWNEVTAPGVAGYLVFRDGSCLQPEISGDRGSANASSWYNNNYLPAKAVDDNPASYWLCRVQAGWFEEIFPDFQFVREITIDWFDAYKPLACDIQLWDGMKYTTLFDFREQPGNLTTLTLPGAGLCIKGYRINFRQAANAYTGLAELSFTVLEPLTENIFSEELPTGSYEYSVTAVILPGAVSKSSEPVQADILPPPASAITTRVAGPNVAVTWEPNHDPAWIGYYLRRNAELLGTAEQLAGTATASQAPSANYPADKAVDGNAATYWYCDKNTTQQWWQLELAEERYLTEIKIDWAYTTTDYLIQVWQKGAWVELLAVTDNSQDINNIVLPQVVKAGRLRLLLLSVSGSRFGISEIQLFAKQRLSGLHFDDLNLKAGSYQYSLSAENNLFCESPPVTSRIEILPPAVPTGLSASLADRDVTLAWQHQTEDGFTSFLVMRNGDPVNLENAAEITSLATAAASSVYSQVYAAANATDGNPATYWSSSAIFPAWFSLIFSRPRVISRIGLEWRSNGYGRDYQLQYLNQGKWYPLQTVSNNTLLDLNYNLNRAILTEGIRIFCTRSSSNYLYLNEIQVDESLLTRTGCVDRNLNDGVYQYRIAAMDSACNISDPSESVQVAVNSLIQPLQLQAAVQDNQIHLNWQHANPAEVAGFNLYRNGQQLNTGNNVAANFTATATVTNARAQYIIDGNTGTSWYANQPAVIELQAAREYRLARIKLLWGSQAALDFDVSVEINGVWQAVAAIRDNTRNTNELDLGLLTTSRIKLEILRAPGGYYYLTEAELLQVNPISALSFTDSVILNGLYSYQASTLSLSGRESGLSNQVTVTVDEKIPPALPQNLTVTRQNTRLTISWSPNTEPDLDGYNIYLNQAEKPINTSLLKTSQSLLTLSNGLRQYRFDVVALDLNGNVSEPATVIYQLPRPPAPENVKAVVDKKDLTVSWTGITTEAIQGYHVYRNGSLQNNLLRIAPQSITASSVFFNLTNYRANYAADNNRTTFWRPALDDAIPVLNIAYTGQNFINTLEVVWQDPATTPESYAVEAWLNDTWIRIATQADFSEATLTFDEFIVTDQLRLVISGYTVMPALVEFNGYKTQINTVITYRDNGLATGVYQYQITAVNAAGLESEKSQPVSAEVTDRDFAILPGDLYYVPYLPSVFDNINIFVRLTNTGSESLAAIPVKLFLGDPAGAGVEIASLTTPAVPPGQKVLLCYEWNPAGQGGAHVIYAVADPDNLINELEEANNTTSRAITISASPVLNSQVTNVDSRDFPRIKVALQIDDASGEGVAGLKKENFSLHENLAAQLIDKVYSIIEEESELCKIDLVFIVDTSGSMSNEWQTLPGILQGLTDALTAEGIDVWFTIYSLQSPASSILNPVPLFFESEPLKTGIFNGQEVVASVECWGPGTSWVAAKYPWRKDAFRVIIPISDENCYYGSGQNASDLASIEEAITLCRENRVEAYPFHGFNDTSESVKDEMRTLAHGTGGEMFFFENANQVVNYLLRVLLQKKANYYLEYVTANPAKDGTLRAIGIESNYRQASGTCQGEYLAPQDTWSDLKAIALTTDTLVTANQPLGLEAWIRNDGGIPASDFSVAFYLGNPAEGGLLLERQSVLSLEASASLILNSSWTALPGQYTIYLVIDPENTLAESDETNNSIFTEILVPGSSLPDLLILPGEISFDTTSPVCYQRVTITARLRNAGSYSGPVDLSFYTDNPLESGSLIASCRLEGLDYLAFADLSVTWITGSNPGEQTIYVIADPLNLIAESNEANNTGLKKILIHESLFAGHITTDQPRYNPYEDCLLDLGIINNQSAGFSGTAMVLIRDAGGNQVQELASYVINDLPGNGGSGSASGEWQQTSVWNTGNLASGQYLACLAVYENNDYKGEFIALFEILPHVAVDGNLNSDKDVYAPAETARFTVDLTNLSYNTDLSDLQLELTLLDTNNQTVWSAGTALAYLPMAYRELRAFSWSIPNPTSGSFRVEARLTDQTDTLWQDSITITVDFFVSLSGTLTVNPGATRFGQEIDLAYTAANIGNRDLANFQVNMLFIDTATDTPLRTLNLPLSLAVGETTAASLSETVALDDGRYMIIMQADVEGELYSLASAGLLVDSTPPVTTGELSLQRFEKAGIHFGILDSRFHLTATDNLSGVAAILYDRGEGYLAYPGPLDFSEEGIYSLDYYSVDNLGNSEPVQTQDIIIDQTPPRTTINPEGTRDSNGNYMSGILINLEAADIPDLSGVEAIYYTLAGGTETLYTGPFTVNKERTTTITFSAVDRAGNREAVQQASFTIVEPTGLSYPFLCQQLRIKAGSLVEHVFSNGKVELMGNFHLDYLGTAQSRIWTQNPSGLTKPETGLPIQSIPQPDWAALKAATQLQEPTILKHTRSLSNARFAESIIIRPGVELSGLLVVDGNVIFIGPVELNDVGIFCTGKVMFTGNGKASGLIYAGSQFRMSSYPEVNAIIVVDGFADICGTIRNGALRSSEYQKWFTE